MDSGSAAHAEQKHGDSGSVPKSAKQSPVLGEALGAELGALDGLAVVGRCDRHPNWPPAPSRAHHACTTEAQAGLSSNPAAHAACPHGEPSPLENMSSHASSDRDGDVLGAAVVGLVVGSELGATVGGLGMGLHPMFTLMSTSARLQYA